MYESVVYLTSRSVSSRQRVAKEKRASLFRLSIHFHVIANLITLAFKRSEHGYELEALTSFPRGYCPNRRALLTVTFTVQYNSVTSATVKDLLLPLHSWQGESGEKYQHPSQNPATVKHLTCLTGVYMNACRPRDRPFTSVKAMTRLADTVCPALFSIADHAWLF